MRLLWFIVCLSVILPANAYSARLNVTIPQGVTEVQLLSPGTASVLEHLKTRFKGQLKTIDEKYQVARLESEVKEASLRIDRAEKAYKDRIDELRKQYISKISITIHSASAQLSPESALGDINFSYTVKNNSDRIISKITYKPLLNKTTLAITSSLVLEFIHPKTLMFGLGPGESITNVGNEPEHFSFFLSELIGKDIKNVQSSLPGGFSIDIIDIHFVSQKEYKGQSKEMDVKEAFAAQLKPIQASFQQVQDELKAKTDTLSSARKLYEKETSGILKAFRAEMKDLKQSSVRYHAPVEPKKNRSMIESIKPGKYYLYASDVTRQAIFEEITIEDGKNKIKIDTLKKDPFEP